MVEAMPPRDEMLAAFNSRDGSYDGLFVAAVRTTGIFCRCSCPARKPEPRNVEFFATAGTALAAGYRPCLRCRPLDPGGAAPAWLSALLADLERDPRRRWTDADLAAAGLRPEAVRRWFRRRFGMTFHGYARARRLAAAVGDLQQGVPVTDAAFDHGYESLSGFSDAIRNLVGTSPGATGGSTLLAVAPVDTPLGVMMLGAVGGTLCLAEFADPNRLAGQLRRVCKRLDATLVPGREPPIDRAAEQIAEYFAGGRRCFELPLRPAGTELQRLVWDTLLRIPHGDTWSYGRVAAEIGRPRAARPVGRAVGANPIAVVIPCHRVVGGNGALTGYGGGLWRKQRLLELERK
ncbi:MAG: methylated-DNA--[protein]-cysteine S-methyltransferase [Spirochaetaceae bacterium]|nr:methylated-DNA--[protein]-cysteine S-methyltransferase [Spirochaetaceae bacterium]